MIRSFLICVALVSLTVTAHAQMSADALGKPLPVAELERGTVTVRVIQGAPDKPYVGVTVQLMAAEGDASRSARTDAQGRATFTGLESGAAFAAKVSTEEGEATSDTFAIPAQGGVRLMLSPAPWQGAASGAAPAGAGQMPSPRARSGVPIPGQVPAGTLSVVAVHGALDKPAADTAIKLVGYDGSGGITYVTRTTDAGGRAMFEGLRNDVAYYAMAILGQAGRYDRVRSIAIVLQPGVGSRLILSGDEKGESVDDLGRMVEPQPKTPLPPGEVIVRLRGNVESIREVELLEVGQTEVIAKAPAIKPGAQAGELAGGFSEAVPSKDQPVGSLALVAARTIIDQPVPLGDIPFEIQLLDDEGAAPLTASSGQQGVAVVESLVPGKRYQLSAVVHGQTFESKPFTMPEEGGVRMGLIVEWEISSPLEARFGGVAAGLDKAYVAQIRDGGTIYRSAPFQLAPDRGAVVGIFLFPKLVFGFHLGGFVDNQFMGFQGQLTLQNFSYEPYDPGPEGLLIPLPRDFVGAQVAEEDQERIKINDRGFVHRGVIPPGGSKFAAGFSLRISDGEVDFDMPLPYGAAESNLNLMYTPGMEVRAPTRQQPQLRTRNGRRFYQISDITILPQRRMVMTITGLPHHPPWHRWVRYAIGLVAVGLLGWALLTVLSPARRRRAAELDAGRAELEKRRDALLDQLVALERDHSSGAVADSKYDKRNKRLRRELEEIYAQLRGGEAGLGDAA